MEVKEMYMTQDEIIEAVINSWFIEDELLRRQQELEEAARMGVCSYFMN